MPHLSIEEAIRDIRDGKMIILVDDEDRENEGDLYMAAEKVTPDAINFMAKYGRGLICLSMTGEKIDSLDLPPMVDNNQSPLGTGFTVSIEARCGVTTGISAADRATTILTAVAETTKPRDLVRPGHIFPLRARDGGVIVRADQTEFGQQRPCVARSQFRCVGERIQQGPGSVETGARLFDLADDHVVSKLRGSTGRLDASQDQPDQGRLAGAVVPRKSDAVPELEARDWATEPAHGYIHGQGGVEIEAGVEIIPRNTMGDVCGKGVLSEGRAGQEYG